jgi:hypothetical protein
MRLQDPLGHVGQTEGPRGVTFAHLKAFSAVTADISQTRQPFCYPLEPLFPRPPGAGRP